MLKLQFDQYKEISKAVLKRDAANTFKVVDKCTQ